MKMRNSHTRHRAGQEKRAKDLHDAHHGKAHASGKDIDANRRKGTATTPARSGAKTKANRDRSDNKKVQSGR